MQTNQLQITYQNQSLDIAYRLRSGGQPTLLYLHGLGCYQRDFQEAFQQNQLKSYSIITFDFPGFGESSCPEPLSLDIDSLVEITHLLIQALVKRALVLVGHSMGGLIALLYILRYPDQAQAFINVEGNLTAEDCFISRKCRQYDFKNFCTHFYPEFLKKSSRSNNPGLQEYAANLQKFPCYRAFFDCCPSLVFYSDQGLLQDFIDLSIPKLFIYGSQNHMLPYLPRLRESNCEVAKINGSAHFPQYDNPDMFYNALAQFLGK